MALNALGRHLALVGFMGAGKTTLAQEVAARIGRRVVDADRLLEGRAQISIGAFFAQRGETEFRVAEASLARETFRQSPPAVVALGGGAVKTPEVQTTLRERALTVFVEIDVDTAWERARQTDRPLAQDEDVFPRLYDERQPLCRDVADAVADDADGIILAAAIHYELGALERLADLVPGDSPVALVADSTVMGIYGRPPDSARRAAPLDARPATRRVGEARTSSSACGASCADRTGTVVALGGGARGYRGLAAAMYLRGVPWVAVPTLVGQVDAGIGGKTAIDIPQGKNLSARSTGGAVVLDEALLTTLPERERRQGEPNGSRRSSSRGEHSTFAVPRPQAALCLRPHDRGVRQWLNLGHTFAHALEAAADYELPHGDAVALGLLAALRVSGRDAGPIIARLDPQPVAVDRDRAWAALQRDKKRTGDAINLVLLGDDGPYVEARPADEVRAALDRLIAP
jgi:shikimate kinase/3-dehydroquinate synthase